MPFGKFHSERHDAFNMLTKRGEYRECGGSFRMTTPKGEHFLDYVKKRFFSYRLGWPLVSTFLIADGVFMLFRNSHLAWDAACGANPIIVPGMLLFSPSAVYYFNSQCINSPNSVNLIMAIYAAKLTLSMLLCIFFVAVPVDDDSKYVTQKIVERGSTRKFLAISIFLLLLTMTIPWFLSSDLIFGKTSLIQNLRNEDGACICLIWACSYGRSLFKIRKEKNWG